MLAAATSVERIKVVAFLETWPMTAVSRWWPRNAAWSGTSGFGLDCVKTHGRRNNEIGPIGGCSISIAASGTHTTEHIAKAQRLRMGVTPASPS